MPLTVCSLSVGRKPSAVKRQAAGRGIDRDAPVRHVAQQQAEQLRADALPVVAALDEEMADVAFSAANAEHADQRISVKGAVVRKPRKIGVVVQAAAEFLRPLRGIDRGFIFGKHLPHEAARGGGLLRGQAAERIRRPGQGVHRHVQHPAVFHGVVFQRPLKSKPGLFQRAAGGGIAGERLGKDAQDVRGFKDPAA